MKRMNVREFRAKVADLGDEPIEVVRYTATIGFWIPQGLTTEPRYRKGVTIKAMGAKTAKLTEEEFLKIAKEIKRVTAEVDALGRTK